MSPKTWMAAAAVAGLLALGAAALVVRSASKKPPDAVASRPGAVDAGGCAVAEKLELLPLPGADGPRVLAWAASEVRFAVDGQPFYSPPDQPRPLAPGTHALTLDGKTAGTASTSVHVAPWKPALFFAVTAPETGLVLLRLGTRCDSCKTSMSEEMLEYTPRRDSTRYLLEESGKALRADDWFGARELLRGVPPKDRRREAFLLLAASLFAEANQPKDARETLEVIARANPASPVGEVLKAYDALIAAEETRRAEVLLARWNKLTERFSALVARFEPEVRGGVERPARRLEQLSEAYVAAAEAKDVAEQEELVRAAHRALVEFVEQLRAQRPADCAFQQQVVATAMQ